MGALDSSYNPATCFQDLGSGYGDLVSPAIFPKTILRFRNTQYDKKVGLHSLTNEEWIRHFAHFEPLPQSTATPIALRYHGHQFRHYNPEIGDGRGFLFAQLYNQGGELLDLGTKGSGTTPYSRGGDGRLTLKGGVREILASEMLEALGVPTSKVFSLIETGEHLMRDDEPSPTRSAVLVRLSKGHIRIGTFQYHAFHEQSDHIAHLVNYCLRTFFSENSRQNPEENALIFLHNVCKNLAHMSATIMASGFVHGVLNSDNINITGECFDYGPWRFLPFLDPHYTAAYFDYEKLYCYSQQPDSILWNLYQLGGTLLSQAREGAIREIIEMFSNYYQNSLREAFLKRLGIKSRGNKEDDALLKDLHNFLYLTSAPLEKVFFDWYGGPKGTYSGRDINNIPCYDHKSFKPFYKKLKEYEPRKPSAAAHPYFQQSKPCTMLIDEVESIWNKIDKDDDWSAFENKINSIRAMGAVVN